MKKYYIKLLNFIQLNYEGFKDILVKKENTSLKDIVNDHIDNEREFSIEEKEMLTNIIGFGKSRVEDSMVPRADIISAGIETSAEEIIKLFSECNHSRIAIYRENLDDPVGMLHIKDFVGALSKKNIEDITLEPLASASAVLSQEEKEAGVALIDIGGGTTDLAIFKDGIIRHTAVIPFGGNIVTEDIKEGCTIIKSQAELLKVKFGSSLANENQENEIVSIPGLRGREPKEISVKNLAHIIQARMEEIIENMYFEIKNSGFEKKLIAGIVITGGGSQLKHVNQLVEYMSGMDTRIGYPNEHLASGNTEDITSPIYSTGVGLVIKGLETVAKQNATNTNKVKGHSTKSRGNFFDAILKKTTQFFEDDTE